MDTTLNNCASFYEVDEKDLQTVNGGWTLRYKHENTVYILGYAIGHFAGKINKITRRW